MTAAELQQGMAHVEVLLRKYGTLFTHAWTYWRGEDALPHWKEIAAPLGVRDWRIVWPEMFAG
eukprot:1494769-Rhodomonas_salina.1